MNIGIVTLHKGNNYGALFQAYALSRYVESLGHNVFIVNYEMDKPRKLDYLGNPIVFFKKMISKNVFSFEFIKGKLSLRKAKKTGHAYGGLFDAFRDKFLNITDEEFDYNALLKKCPKADAFICGSDQVWAADVYFSTPAFLLGFVPDGVRRVSYAPSFGKSKLESYLKPVFAKHLQRFHALSVREKSGVDIVRDVCGLDAAHVVDPTLLLEDYSEIVDYSMVPDEPYILVYRLGQELDLTNWTLSSIEGVQESHGLPVMSVSTNCPWVSGDAAENLTPTPGQLLGLIENSKLVITNSFHGTVFSIVLRANFIALARDRYENKQNLRLTGLLNSLDLGDRYCSPFQDLDSVLGKTRAPCFSEATFNKLAVMRSSSSDYLKKALM